MLKVEIDLTAIRHNYRCLAGMTRARILPVIKADAYGHGLLPVAAALGSEGADMFAVGTVDEACLLKKEVPGKKVYSLLGPADHNDAQKLALFKIVPFIHSWSQLKSLVSLTSTGQRQSIVLKFDTGMTRLGFKPQDAEQLCLFLKKRPDLMLEAVSSHLACADDPAMRAVTSSQHERLHRVQEIFQKQGLDCMKSMGNSAATLEESMTPADLVRPGIALYGVNPFQGTAFQSKGAGLKPAMEVSAPVLAVKALKKNQGVSYGLSFTAPRDMLVAIIGCGYADGYSRSLSNRAWMSFKGSRLPVLGRVCMQLTAVDASQAPEIRPGNEVLILGRETGSGISIYQLAGWWNTVSYEVLCVLGKNQRTYPGR
ncbi:alanine racemase [Desulfonatronovibrio hydrogenovorans]|uniref:alanine racemase n=1 Tax=Desulfonatronovibrio hydrogenovorans TaxID=53245 RepID=UPI000557C61D|nr:alanine racemase [Desulfonatronovibrio hydrogenovorans]